MELEPPIIPHTDIWETKVYPGSSLLVPHFRRTGNKCPIYHRDLLTHIRWFGGNDDRCIVAVWCEECKVAYEVW
jgi:hypothetical protein